MTTQLPFSATDSLTGYLFQVKYALLDALQRLKEDDGSEINTAFDYLYNLTKSEARLKSRAFCNA